MPDPNHEDARRDFALAELVGRIGNMYVRTGLSPPFALRDAIRSWRGLSQDEIVAVLQQHFAEHRRLYHGSGDGNFWMVQAAMRRAIEAKHPLPRDEPVRPRLQRRAAGVRKIHHAGGTDIYDDRRDLEWIREVAQPRPAPPESYRESGESIGEDDDTSA